MKYNIKDTVWIHIGERKLTKGRVVEIIDLSHLEEGYDPNREFYIIEIETGIDNIFEVRDYDQISSDAKGPINLFKKHKKELTAAHRYLKKVGIIVPVEQPILDTVESEETVNEPTNDEIHAALDRAQQESRYQPLAAEKRMPGKKRFYAKRRAKKHDQNQN